MREAFWGYLLVILGIFLIVVLMLVQNYTSTSEEDFYLTKEVMEAAMIDSIDYGVYREYGEIRMISDKFVENFTRRFAQSVNNNKSYTLEFYEVYETPPKATVLIKTKTGSYNVSANTDSVDLDILTNMSGILETKYTDNEKSAKVNVYVENGSSNIASKYIRYNDNAEFTITPDSNYSLEGASVICNNGYTASLDGNVLKVENITSSTTCNVSLKEAPVKVKLTVINGVVMINSSSTHSYSTATKGIDNNASATFSIKPNSGYTVNIDSTKSKCDNGSEIKMNGSTVTINNVKTKNDTEICYITLTR